MPLPDFDDLPFDERPDLTPYLIHLTKNTTSADAFSAFDNLVNILRHGEIWGSTTTSGHIRGTNPAACFMDVPFVALKYILNKQNADPDDPRYEPFGVVVTKKYAYKHGCRPVLYLSNTEERDLGIPDDERWRVVRFEVGKDGWLSWLHEREWRTKGNFRLPSKVAAVLVRSQAYVAKLQEELAVSAEAFRSTPNSILPLNVVCQGLRYL